VVVVVVVYTVYNIDTELNDYWEKVAWLFRALEKRNWINARGFASANEQIIIERNGGVIGGLLQIASFAIDLINKHFRERKFFGPIRRGRPVFGVPVPLDDGESANARATWKQTVVRAARRRIGRKRGSPLGIVANRGQNGLITVITERVITNSVSRALRITSRSTGESRTVFVCFWFLPVIVRYGRRSYEKLNNN